MWRLGTPGTRAHTHLWDAAKVGTGEHHGGGREYAAVQDAGEVHDGLVEGKVHDVHVQVPKLVLVLELSHTFNY